MRQTRLCHPRTRSACQLRPVLPHRFRVAPQRSPRVRLRHPRHLRRSPRRLAQARTRPAPLSPVVSGTCLPSLSVSALAYRPCAIPSSSLPRRKRACCPAWLLCHAHVSLDTRQISIASPTRVPRHFSCFSCLSVVRPDDSRGRKIRCDSARPSCNNCVRRNNACEYDAVPKRRGPDKVPGMRKRAARPTQPSTPPSAGPASATGTSNSRVRSSDEETEAPRRKRRRTDATVASSGSGTSDSTRSPLVSPVSPPTQNVTPIASFVSVPHVPILPVSGGMRAAARPLPRRLLDRVRAPPPITLPGPPMQAVVQVGGKCSRLPIYADEPLLPRSLLFRCDAHVTLISTKLSREPAILSAL
jgi:hypothetical protein